MAYFKINNIDFSMCVNALSVISTPNYSAQMNAAGNTVIDYINSKRTFEVGIIPLTSTDMMALQSAISNINVEISFLNPNTNEIEENIKCFLPSNAVSYYTIQAGKVLFNAFSLSFIEL